MNDTELIEHLFALGYWEADDAETMGGDAEEIALRSAPGYRSYTRGDDAGSYDAVELGLRNFRRDPDEAAIDAEEAVSTDRLTGWQRYKFIGALWELWGASIGAQEDPYL